MPIPLPGETEAQLTSLASTYGTPLQLYDEKSIRGNAKNLIETFRRQFTDFREYFAVKALPNPAIIKILHQEGCGMDCSSTAELHICKELGIDGNDIMFTSNFTSKARYLPSVM